MLPYRIRIRILQTNLDPDTDSATQTEKESNVTCCRVYFQTGINEEFPVHMV
jgi:hypothetical protein